MMPCFDDFLPNSGWGDYFFLPFDLLLLRLIMCAGWVVFFFFFWATLYTHGHGTWVQRFLSCICCGRELFGLCLEFVFRASCTVRGSWPFSTLVWVLHLLGIGVTSIGRR